MFQNKFIVTILGILFLINPGYFFPNPNDTYNIQVLGGTKKGLRYLSVTSYIHGDYVTPGVLMASVGLTPYDDGSGLQKWKFRHLKDNVYNILVFDGYPKGYRYLSFQMGLSNQHFPVVTWNKDDEFTTEWILKKNGNDTFYIMPYASIEGHHYLSAPAFPGIGAYISHRQSDQM